MKLSAKRMAEIERWALGEMQRQRRPTKVWQFTHKRHGYEIVSTINALRRADKPPKEGTKAGREYDERRAKAYMTWKLGSPVYHCKWDGNRVRWVFCDGAIHEIPHWNA